MAYDPVTVAVLSVACVARARRSDVEVDDAGDGYPTPRKSGDGNVRTPRRPGDGDDPTPRRPGWQGPPRAQAHMNTALRAELARRMPALNAGMIALRQGRNVDLATAIRDAHTLAKGSALLGEASAAAALRRVESELATPQAKRNVHVIAEQLMVASLALAAWLDG